MRNFLAGVLIVAALLIVAANVYDGSNSRIAAALSSFQIDSILDLLKAFNVDDKTVNEVRDAFNNAANDTSGTGTTTDESVVEEATDDTPVAIQGTPSCTLASTHTTPLHYDSVTVSWDSTNASHVVFNPETTGVTSAKDLPLPEGQRATSGSMTFVMGAEVKHQIRMTAFGADGLESMCSITINVLDPTSGGNYRGFINGTLFIETASVRRFDALENCEREASAYPDAQIRCTWNEDVIFTQN